MKTSSLEITEQEYLIKLSKQEFDLAFIHQLLKRIQAEQSFFNTSSKFLTDDLESRKYTALESRFDHLNDK